MTLALSEDDVGSIRQIALLCHLAESLGRSLRSLGHPPGGTLNLDSICGCVTQKLTFKWCKFVFFLKCHTLCDGILSVFYWRIMLSHDQSLYYAPLKVEKLYLFWEELFKVFMNSICE